MTGSAYPCGSRLTSRSSSSTARAPRVRRRSRRDCARSRAARKTPRDFPARPGDDARFASSCALRSRRLQAVKTPSHQRQRQHRSRMISRSYRHASVVIAVEGGDYYQSHHNDGHALRPVSSRRDRHTVLVLCRNSRGRAGLAAVSPFRSSLVSTRGAARWIQVRLETNSCGELLDS